MRALSRRQLLQGSVALAGLGLLTGCDMVPQSWQPPAKVPRVGVLYFGSMPGGAQSRAAFLEGLRDLGYVEGENLTIDTRFADGQLQRLTDQAAELVALHPDVMLSNNPESTRAVQQLSSAIPIVTPALQDPVETGQVVSLSRPGGNLTGFRITAGLEAQKRLELLKDVVPSMSRVAILWDRYSARRSTETVASAQALGLDSLPLELQDGSDLDAHLALASAGGCDGLVVTGSFQMSAYEQQIVDTASKLRLPAMYSIVTAGPRGGLLAYAPSIIENYRRAATYVDKILKGARPADLPIEQPTTFDFIINLKTAQALGLTVPPSVLQQATEIIQ